MGKNETFSSSNTRLAFLLTCKERSTQPIRFEDFKEFETWRIRHKKAKVGDEVYLLKQDKGSRGIFGRGVIIKAPYHPSDEERTEIFWGWAYQRSREDWENNRWVVDIRIDEITDPNKGLFLTLADLSHLYPPASLWHRQPSGLQIPENVVEAIRNSRQWKTSIIPAATAEPEIISKTSSEATIEIRIGQQQFRQNLLQYWRGCSVTGCSFHEMLIASHIVPWSEASDMERLDLYNGLLLTPNLDKLFDNYFISFNSLGQILISKVISSKAMSNLGINSSMKLRRTDERLLSYLQKHEKEFLEREQAR